MKPRMMFCRMVVVSLAVAAPSLAEPIYSSQTGSYYELVNVPGTYGDAKIGATMLSYAGRQGRLATIESKAENDFVYGLLCLPGNRNLSWFLGGEHTPGQPSDTGWTWITGVPFTYSNWLAGEPNNGWPSEDVVYWDGPDIQSRTGGQWCDISREGPNPYIVEYAAPEPSSLALLALGAIALRRRLLK